VQSLDVVTNLHDVSYKVPGLLAWGILVFTVVGVWAYPYMVLGFARVLAFYTLLRIFVIFLFYLAGLVRIRRAERRVRSGAIAADARPLLMCLEDVHHVVIIPNCEEPAEVLTRTLDGLAGQADTRRNMTVVLAMEEAEKEAEAKARELATRYQNRFNRVLISVHPANLPGEVPGKGANQSWAARQARRELVDRQGLRLEHLTLTSCDSDSVFHPHYFAELARLFASDPDRYRRFWQAPLRFDNNPWQTTVPVRILTFFANAVHLSELANPWGMAMPVSTYSTSFKLVHDVGYWDATVISEDWHMYLRCMFANKGQIGLTPIFLPVSGDAIVGNTGWQALRNFYNQQLRHAWGCQDISYILQQWRRTPDTPVHRKGGYLLKILHDHMLFSIGGIVIPVGTVLAFLYEGAPFITLPPGFMYQSLLHAVNVASAGAIWSLWMGERIRLGRRGKNWNLFTLIQEIVAWAILALWTFFTMSVPMFHAQTKMLWGKSLSYVRTPKKAEAH
jgi:cellulose synthase/poly-beta-1,6-N-acetylglucosamine synthase-like glycosyltransferase